MQKENLPKVQAAEVNYELHTLGWKAFQNLCVAITGEVWGQTVQSFFDSKDGGRDGAFYGKWKNNGESFKGSFTVQCKFSSKINNQIRFSDLKSEFEKASILAKKNLADNYFLFTNSYLTGRNDEIIKKQFESIPGLINFRAYGHNRICQIIRESPKLRMLVPRVYGLGDLSQILDARAYDQAKEILSALSDDLSKFVITEAFNKSAQALVNHGFVLLLGEPASGKSTIAAALAMGALDIWGCSTIKIRDADDFVKHSNPHESKQFFWVDDAFGTTQFDWIQISSWNRVFPHLNAAIRRGARVLFTSRDYIYRSSKQYLKESSFPLIKESQVVINVELLTKSEKEQILYNHIRLGEQTTQFKTKVKPFLSTVSDHNRFSPEIARRLGNPAFTTNLYISNYGLESFVENQIELLHEIIQALDVNSRSALALIFMRSGMLSSPIKIFPEEQNAMNLFGGDIYGVRTALNALEGSFVIYKLQNEEYAWHFKHPTIFDAFGSIVAEDRELMGIYLTGAPLVKIFNEVSCGKVGIEGIKVIVPKNYFSLLLDRLVTFDTTKIVNIWALSQFLAFRCNKEFLILFKEKYPGFILSLNIGSYLYAIPQIDVIIRFFEYGILDESFRLKVITKIKELAIDTPDSGFLLNRVRQIINKEEFDDIIDSIKIDLLPNLKEKISNWELNYNHEDDPEEYFSEFKSTLSDLRNEFEEDYNATQYIDEAQSQIDSIIEELKSEIPPENDTEDFYSNKSKTFEQESERSIYDDVDQ